MGNANIVLILINTDLPKGGVSDALKLLAILILSAPMEARTSLEAAIAPGLVTSGFKQSHQITAVCYTNIIIF